MKTNLHRFVVSILAQRRRLIEARVSRKNNAVCMQYIRELSLQVEAYKNRWDETGWKKFVERNLNKLEYLIPENKAGQKIKEKLCKSIQ